MYTRIHTVIAGVVSICICGTPVHVHSATSPSEATQAIAHDAKWLVDHVYLPEAPFASGGELPPSLLHWLKEQIKSAAIGVVVSVTLTNRVAVGRHNGDGGEMSKGETLVERNVLRWDEYRWKHAPTVRNVLLSDYLDYICPFYDAQWRTSEQTVLIEKRSSDKHRYESPRVRDKTK